MTAPSSFRSVLGMASVALVAWLAVAGLRGSRELAAARGRADELRARIERTEARIGALERRIRRLQADPWLLERLARERLHMVRPGDVVLVLAEAPPPRREPPAPSAAPPSPDRPGPG